MIIGKKFWPLELGYQVPGKNPVVNFVATASGNTTLTGVAAATVATIATLITALKPVGISGQYIQPGTLITAAAATTLTLSQTAGNTNSTMLNVNYWDATFPSAAGGDGAVEAILVLAASHAALTFIDTAGKTISIPANTLVKGAVYYFGMYNVTTVTSGEFLGYSSM